MDEFVTDTHALVWHLTTSNALSAAARLYFEQADQGRARIHVPAITLVEMVYLGERGRIPATLLQRALDLTSVPQGSYTVSPLDTAVARRVVTVPRLRVPELPDRVIVATALALGLP